MKYLKPLIFIFILFHYIEAYSFLPPSYLFVSEDSYPVDDMTSLLLLKNRTSLTPSINTQANNYSYSLPSSSLIQPIIQSAINENIQPKALTEQKKATLFTTIKQKVQDMLNRFSKNTPSINTASSAPETPSETPPGATAPPNPQSTPPPGFEDIDLEETNAIDVYYGDLYLGQFIATYTNDYIQFKDPLSIVQKIPLVKDVPPVTRALTGKLSTHAEKICTKKDVKSVPENTCGYLEPEIAGVLFNWGLFQANLFINPNYLKDVEHTIQFLPPSTGGYGLVTGFSGAATQTSSQANTSREYTFSNDSVIGYRENNLSVNTIYTTGDQAQSKDGYLKIVKTAFNREIHGKLYQTGILSLSNSSILPTDEVLGFGFSNSRNTIANLQEFQTAPLTVYLSTASNVQIYKNDQLLWSKILPMGKNIIDTSGFPSGSYPIQIKMTDMSGQIIQSQQFFSKNSAFPSPYFPDYSIIVGQRKNSSTDSNSRELFNKYDLQKLLNFSYAKGLKYPYGFRLNGLFIEPLRSYLEGGLFYLTEIYNISSGALVSNQQDYGFYANLTYSKANFSNSTYLRKMLSKNETSNNPDNYDPVAGSLLSLSDSITYLHGKDSFGASISFNQSPESKTTTDFGLSWGRPLLTRNNFLLAGSINATQASNSKSISLQLNLSFPKNKYRPTITETYKQRKTKTQNLQGHTTSANIQYQHQTENYSAGFNLTGTKDLENNTLLATGNYDNHTLVTNIQANYTQLHNQQSPIMTYTLNFGSNIAYNPEGYGISSNGLPLSGIIIKVKDNNHAKYKVIIDGSPSKIVNSNASEAIFLQPYATYVVNLVAVDMNKNINLQSEAPTTTVTLYPGNLQVLTWQAHLKTILIGQALNQNKEPLVGYNVTGGISSDTTMEEGYFQIDAIDSTKELVLMNSENKPFCKIQLPEFNVKEEYVMLKELICRPIH